MVLLSSEESSCGKSDTSVSNDSNNLETQDPTTLNGVEDSTPNEQLNLGMQQLCDWTYGALAIEGGAVEQDEAGRDSSENANSE